MTAEVKGNLLTSRSQMLAVAESCTGGLLGHTITGVPGSSHYFAGGIVAYSDSSKIEVLGVTSDIIRKYGAVSKRTAQAMASRVIDHFVSDIGIAITGIAGPGGGTPEKPIGTVYIAVASEYDEMAEEYHFSGTRENIKEASVETAIKLAIRFLKD